MTVMKAEEKNSTQRRYSLSVPANIYHDLQQLAEREDVSVVDLVRQFLKLGIIIKETPGAKVVISDPSGNGAERELVFL